MKSKQLKRMIMVKDIFYVLRPQQWSKNLLIFAPAFFGGMLFNDLKIFILMIVSFFSFSLISSTSYIINDLIDIEKDKLHPTKKFRPIASGRLIPIHAFIISVICIVIAFGISSELGTDYILVLGLYLLLGIGYSLFLQYLVILDSFTIAIGFVLRILAGGYASGIHVSSWLLLTTFLVSVLLAFGKRRNEISLVAGSANPFRKVLKEYSIQFLDAGIIIFATTSIVSFSIYAVEIGKREFLISVPFACYGILRYLQIVYINIGVDPTEAFLKDRALFISVIIWIIVTGIMVYFKDIINLIATG